MRQIFWVSVTSLFVLSGCGPSGGEVSVAANETTSSADGALHTCKKTTCAAQHAECGEISDGCSDFIDCGGCPSRSLCTSNVCAPACVPKTCADLGATCGPALDGCGSTIQCGSCGAGTSCDPGTRRCQACPAPTGTCTAVGALCAGGTGIGDLSTCDSCLQCVAQWVGP